MSIGDIVMKKLFCFCIIVIGVFVNAQNKTTSKNMNDEFKKYVEEGQGKHSSEKKSYSYVDTKTGTTKNVSAKELYENTKNEADESWNTSGESRKKRRESRRSESPSSVRVIPANGSINNASPISNNESSTRKELEENLFLESNKAIKSEMKGFPGNKTSLKLKGLNESSTKVKLKQYNEMHSDPIIQTDILADERNRNSSTSCAYLPVGTVVCDPNEPTYLARTWESLTHKERKSLLLAERKKMSLVKQENRVQERIVWSDFYKPLVDDVAKLQNEVTFYASIGFSKTWRLLKQAATGEEAIGFYNEVRDDVESEAKNYLIQEGIRKISKMMKEIIASTGHLGNEVLVVMKSIKVEKDVVNVHQRIMDRSFNNIMESVKKDNMENITSHSYAIREVNSLACRNVEGYFCPPLSKKEVSGHVTDYITKKAPEKVLNNYLFK